MYIVRSLRQVAWAAPLLLLPLAVVLPFGCATGGNGDGGDGGLGGDEVVIPTDTGMKDGITMMDSPGFPDTFGGGDMGAPDTSDDMDGGKKKPKDAGTETSPMDAGGTKDTGVDTGKCVAVTVSDAGGTATTCPATGTACGDKVSVTSFTPTTVPPTTPSTTACTSTEISTIYNDCFGTGSATACQDDATTYATCYNCIFTEEGATANGAAILSKNGGLVFFNQSGCIDLLEPCNSACADAYQAAVECELAGCESNCPAPLNSTTGMEFEECVDDIVGCKTGCLEYGSEAANCGALLTGTMHPASVCVSGTTPEATFMNVVPVFCGG